MEDEKGIFNVDPIKVADLIKEKILELYIERPKLFDSAQSKASAISEYDKAMAIAVIKLRNGVEMMLEGEKIINPPATLIPIISKGICWN